MGAKAVMDDNAARVFAHHPYLAFFVTHPLIFSATIITVAWTQFQVVLAFTDYLKHQAAARALATVAIEMARQARNADEDET